MTNVTMCSKKQEWEDSKKSKIRMSNLSTILTVNAGDRSGSNAGANMPWITPGDSTQSYLLYKIIGTHSSVGGGGSTMPFSGPVSQSDIDDIELWINQGAN